MKIHPDRPFRLVYALYQHQYLGALWEGFLVQLDERGRYSLQYQAVSEQNIPEFSHGLDATDQRLLPHLDALRQEAVVRHFGRNPRQSATDFFLKNYSSDKALQAAVGQYLEEHRRQLLPALHDRPLFAMSNDGQPTHQPLHWEAEAVRVRFHVMRNADSTHYFPTLLHQGERLPLLHQPVLLLAEEPACLLLNNRIFHFRQPLDGKKLTPFFTKKFINVPRSLETDFYTRFVTGLLAQFEVQAKGFEVEIRAERPTPALLLHDTPEALTVQLAFHYGGQAEPWQPGGPPAYVQAYPGEGSGWRLVKIRRDAVRERHFLRLLGEWQLPLPDGQATLSPAAFYHWLDQHRARLAQAGFAVQTLHEATAYVLGEASLQLEVLEQPDWFDLRGMVRFGEVSLPLTDLRNCLLAGERALRLPDGRLALIPAAWAGQYQDIMLWASPENKQQSLRLRKPYAGLLEALTTCPAAAPAIPLPAGLQATLRPYQQAGYAWLHRLRQQGRGGCLADDMGLGKTLQTLALLLWVYETDPHTGPSLLVMPTSLLDNWEAEARRFTPGLRISVYAGPNRRERHDFNGHDLVLTTYGTLRQDIDLLQHEDFHYVILDESQVIKNPEAAVSRAVGRLRGRHRLALTGTPLENSVLDLWSQMHFLNPGLLDSQAFFRKHYQLPIEKQQNTTVLEGLRRLVGPYVLRRRKEQVAADLPPKTEWVHYCRMSQPQAERYEAARQHYRRLLLEGWHDTPPSRLAVLQGLTVLRQLANHPRMLDAGYEGPSGKMEEVLHLLDTVLSEGHKVLIFSQFVRHLALLKEAIEKRGIRYAYLDGQTTDRPAAIRHFTGQTQVQVFLLSLRAGGVGLNLTEADYVFLLDPWWNPTAEAQAVDRSHRIGQQRPVFTYRFIVKDSIEEKIRLLQQRKQALASSVLGGDPEGIGPLDRQELEDLLGDISENSANDN